MNWFERNISARFFDYGWAYRTRLSALRRHRPDRYLEGGVRPVLILPGVYETWHFLEPVAAHLNALGHPVHVIPDFGRNVRPVPEMTEVALRYIEDADLRDLTIIGHSKGGLIGKSIMVSRLGDRVDRMVAINSPFGGSDYARFVPIARLREFVPTHETIVLLAMNAEVNARITSVYSTWDPVIPNGSVLDGATNIEIAASGHFRILDHPDVLRVVGDIAARLAP